MVTSELFEQNKALAGYSFKKNNQQNIMFMKEEVIQAHYDFLSASPAPIFEP